MKLTELIRKLSLLMLLFVGLGCSSESPGPERVPVAGRITWNGEPLPTGQIRLQPLDPATAPVATGKIVDGNYSIDNLGGVVPAKYRVQITAQRVISPAANPEDQVTEQYLPENYHRNTILELQVPTGADSVSQDFELRSP